MPQYAKPNNVTKHERDRALRQRAHLRPATYNELMAMAGHYSNPIAPPQHDNAVQLDAWAAHVQAGYIVK